MKCSFHLFFVSLSLITASAALSACSKFSIFNENTLFNENTMNGDAPLANPQSMGEEAKSKGSLQRSSLSASMGLGEQDAQGYWQDFFEKNKTSGSHTSEILGFFPLSLEKPMDPPLFFALDGKGKLLLWSGRAASQESALVMELPGRPALFAMDRELRHLAYVLEAEAGSGEAQLQVQSIRGPQENFVLDRLRTRVNAIDFQPGEDAIFVGGADGRIYRWFFREPRRGEITEYYSRDLERYIGHAASISDIAAHPLGRVFFSGDWSGGLSAWLTYVADPFGGQYDKDIFFREYFTHQKTQKQARRAGELSIDHIEVPLSGELVLIAIDSGKFELWDVRGWQLLAEQHIHQGLIYSLTSSASGQTFVSCGRDGYLRVWQIFESRENSEGELRYAIVLAYEVEFPGVRALRFVNDSLVVAGSETGEILKLDVSKLHATPPAANEYYDRKDALGN